MSMHLAKRLAAPVLALAMAAAPAFAAVSAEAADPTGTWQTTGGESRYQVSFCGDGTQLCAKLTWLRDDARTAENLPYLGAYVLRGATFAGANQWKGSVSYNGETYRGRLVLVDSDEMTLKGCKGMFCQSLEFTRV